MARPALEDALRGTRVPINQERLRKLMDFGLTEYQARVYLTLLDLGSATASQVPALSRVPRTRIYATMQQLHEKGLVEIVPETPLKYKAVPFATFLLARSKDYRERAVAVEANLESLSREFAILARDEPEVRGRFEAVYGRRNVRERLIKMYTSAEQEVYGLGTEQSPGRIMKAFGQYIIDKSKAGVKLRYAYRVTDGNLRDVEVLRRYAAVRHVEFTMPVYMHVVDRREFLMSHPIPDDDAFYRGEDIAIWTNDPAISEAIGEMSRKIWETGVDIGAATEKRERA